VIAGEGACESGRGEAHHPFEDTGEVERIRKPEFGGDGLDGGARQQALGREIHSEALQGFVGAVVVEAAKETAEVGGVHVAFSGELSEGAQVHPTPLKEIPTPSISRERGGGRGAMRDCGVSEAEKELLQDKGCQPRVPGRTPQAGSNEFVEECGDLGRRRGLAGYSRHESGFPEERASSGPGEIHEVLHQGALGVMGDLVRETGPIDEDGACGEGPDSPSHVENALAPRHKLNSPVGKITAANLIAGRAVFASPADHREGNPPRRREVEVKPSRGGDECGEEARRVTVIHGERISHAHKEVKNRHVRSNSIHSHSLGSLSDSRANPKPTGSLP
jgi:hypothetical protein